ncbi:E3 ubiquitin-protein ligase MARCHF6 [Centruroides vittatus]|uniref:E3 ubiquitin-protein ligase MARCHF6 n=1 Tax=Centruroides vittatus TaxID=120091 RepID=UPI00350F957D
MDDTQQQDICRVCRSEGAPDRPLYHPCICTGSIKYIHQECLLQWLKYSRKEYCELCNHRFAFTPIYSPDMPKRLPVKDIISGLLCSLGTAIRYWLHYTLVAFAWLGVVPLTACRIYRCLFTGSVSSLLTLPLDMLSSENIFSDSFYGCCVVTCTLCAFISLVWLREQIMHGGGPEWLEQEQEGIQNEPGIQVPAENNNAPNVMDGLADAVPNGEIGENIGNNANNGGQDDINWNPIEWDRAAEELTWEKLLGLDGSLIFLEHVFWVVSLNTLLILVFAFCPYHIGHFTIVGMKLKDFMAATQFEGLLTTLCGYVVIGIALVFLHALAALIKLKKTKRLLGLCYVVVKVSLLSVVEIGVFPLVCGWWLDICSLTMLDASLQDREESFKIAPGTSMFIHWLVGMVYVFYFASFILLLREVLRPGVLWFLRNLNDPDFNPIQEMIHLPILRHIRRLLASLVTFGTTVLIMVWIPVRIIEKVFPGFLPYNVILSSETPVSELSLELVLLQVVLPALLEQGHTRLWLKTFVRAWCVGVSYILDLRSYLLGSDPVDNQNLEPVIQPEQLNDQPREQGFQHGALAAAHQALLQGNGPTGFQPYRRPKYFILKIICLLTLICASLMIGSLGMLTIPVFFGRKLMKLWMGNTKVHELYTAACGLYICWLSLRILTLLFGWLPRGWNAVASKLQEWMIITSKSLVAMSILLGIIPLLMGLLFDLVIIVPLRVPLYQTPLISLWQDWALGILQTKIICAVTLMGPSWWMKRVIEQVYQGGFRRIDLKLIFCELSLPVITVLGLLLSGPYIAACSFTPMFGAAFEMQNLILRRIYPAVLAVYVIVGILIFQVRQFFRLYEHIKNDKYLVGRRLVNYEHKCLGKLGNHNSEQSSART